MDDQPDAVGGGRAQVRFYPNSRNVLPGTVVFTVDIRSPDQAKLDAMRRARSRREAARDLRGARRRLRGRGGRAFRPGDLRRRSCVERGARRGRAARLLAPQHRLRRRARRLLGGEVAPAAMVMCPCVDGLSPQRGRGDHPGMGGEGGERAVPRGGGDGGDRGVSASRAVAAGLRDRLAVMEARLGDRRLRQTNSRWTSWISSGEFWSTRRRLRHLACARRARIADGQPDLQRRRRSACELALDAACSERACGTHACRSRRLATRISTAMSWTMRCSHVAREMRAAIRTHRDASGHDLSWHHPTSDGPLPDPPKGGQAVPDWPSSWPAASGTGRRWTGSSSGAPRSDRGTTMTKVIKNGTIVTADRT